MKDKQIFKNPPRTYNPKCIQHNWDGDVREIADRILNRGYGGVVTNIPRENGFLSNPDNFDRFSYIIDILDEKEMPFWIYDENGYPSGQAGGLTLEGHPEYAAKGMFMYKRFALVPTTAKYHLPDEADKIVWAAKYKFGSAEASSRVDYSTATAVDFRCDYVECELEDHEALFVFCVKTAHEGTHGMHNVFSQNQNINIMDKRAVRRFIDVAYEPIAKNVCDAFKRAEYVFTDEPSLFTAYLDETEVWPYAMAPWTDCLFEAYEEEYGKSLLPDLPLIFEGDQKSYPVRINYYELVAKLTAQAYSGQLSEWCEAHGCGFSGHYFGEERIPTQVSFYGNYLRVLMGASYPGIDSLHCFPEIYQFVTAKIPQMAVRKKNTNGMMVELCPFYERAEFDKAPYENMKCTTALAYMSGARISNSYFQLRPDSNEDDKMRDFNNYTGRLGYLLDGLKPECNTFIYYPIEALQAKTIPLHTVGVITDAMLLEERIKKLVQAVEYNGFDFFFADNEDILSAIDAMNKTGKPKISECAVKTVIVPEIDVIRRSTADALLQLQKNGVNVYFAGLLPNIAAEDGTDLVMNGFKEYEIDLIIDELYKELCLFNERTGKKIVKAKFNDTDKTIHMLVNMERTDSEILYNSEVDGEIWNPDDGSTSEIKANEKIRIPSCRALFVMTKKAQNYR